MKADDNVKIHTLKNIASTVCTLLKMNRFLFLIYRLAINAAPNVRLTPNVIQAKIILIPLHIQDKYKKSHRFL